MRKGRASQTAQVVAFFRRLARFQAQPLVADQFAESLLEPPYSTALALAGAWPRTTAALLGGVSALTGDASRHFELRTRAIDDVVNQAVADGARQVVLLGAGLDARAFRLQSLASCSVFSVDHPDTQEAARMRFAGRLSVSQALAWVPVTFGRDALDAALLNAGFQPLRQAVVVWEGVTMYLPKPAVQSTVRTLASLLATGSRLAATYRDPRDEVIGRLAGFFAGAVGESFESAYLPRDIAALLNAHGFDVLSDEGHAEWTARWLNPHPRVSMERLVTARRGAAA